jgi:hypothetical protein
MSLEKENHDPMLIWSYICTMNLACKTTQFDFICQIYKIGCEEKENMVDDHHSVK